MSSEKQLQIIKDICQEHLDNTEIDSIRLSDNVIEFINEKNLSAIKSSMDLVEEQSDKAAKEQRDLNTINKGDE